jgi:LacI family transcriptional regulator
MAEIDHAMTGPVSYIDTYWQPELKLDKNKVRNFIGADEEAVSTIVGDYLTKMGHQNVLFYSFELDEEPSVIQKRLIAFQKKFKGKIEYATSPSTNYLEILKGVKPYLKARPFTAIFATADILAAKLSKIFKDISIIGVDDAEFDEFIVPALTTVRIDQLKKGKIAMKLLSQSIVDSSSSAYYDKPKLIIRDSVKDLKTHKDE